MRYQIERHPDMPNLRILHFDIKLTRGLIDALRQENTKGIMETALPGWLKNLRKRDDVYFYVVYESDAQKLGIGKRAHTKWESIIPSILMEIYMSLASQEAKSFDIDVERSTDLGFMPIKQDKGRRWKFNSDFANKKKKEAKEKDKITENDEYKKLIESWFYEAKHYEATHMLVVDDREKDEFFPVYVAPEDDPLEIFLEYEDSLETEVFEVYWTDVDFETQYKYNNGNKK